MQELIKTMRRMIDIPEIFRTEMFVGRNHLDSSRHAFTTSACCCCHHNYLPYQTDTFHSPLLQPKLFHPHSRLPFMENQDNILLHATLHSLLFFHYGPASKAHALFETHVKEPGF